MVTYRTSAVAGTTVFVAGMVGRDPAGQGLDGLGPQAARSLERIAGVLAVHGLDLSDVVRLRIYMIDISSWPTEVRPVVAKAFADELPPAAVLEVGAFVEPWMEIEIEVEAGLRTMAS